ncbi:DUF6438 domain-containing protein [Flavobacterium luteolum]|uniref:DUF6438 domain-containing protein n=1 Tax=Flavobacterium luteolum TaxID=3003259 RepID=UPI00248F345D|nr:DUF6438 domain-containing protein [Flavobacterium luteolum]
MKKLTLIFVIIFSNVAFGNKIDELKTDKDVEDFIKTVAPEFVKKVWKDFDYGNFRIVSTDSIYTNLKCQKIFNQSDINNWKKVDINNDGLTDLLFIPHYYGYSQYAIIDQGSNNFKLTRFIIDFSICEYVKPIKVKDKNELQIRKVNLPFDFDDNIEKYIKIDTLTYKFNSFIELNDKVIIDNKIKSIEVKTDYCFGTCPVFKLTINKNGLAEFDGIEFTKFRGKSIKQFDPKNVAEIFDLLNYIEIKKLKDYYEVNYTDASTATLDITFEDGSIKKIKDYGLSGTYGLSALYSKLTKLATETEWK